MEITHYKRIIKRKKIEELKRSIPKIKQKILTDNLRSLEQDELYRENCLCASFAANQI
ncbi:MAG: winged helix-turn-helix transcriptional regulator [Endomicrobium sp.]|jgi:DNA-binding HxlR family transcriptional regulator|nr:winged helix-turn-helix transcriptional regulator [Endomicrobium sp.]